MPWSVLDSAAYAGLSHPARSLLWEIARQFVRDNNGRLLASLAYLSKRGWKSADVITRAKRELLAAGFIHETVPGQRPNKASWYAVTWQSLDRLPGYDAGAVETFQRGAYRNGAPLKNASLRPSHGVEVVPIAPSHGTGNTFTTPSHGAINPAIEPLAMPSRGNHLDMPSAEAFSGASEQSAIQVERAVVELSPPRMDDAVSGDRDTQMRVATSESIAQSDAQAIVASASVFERDNDLLDSLYVVQYIEEQERTERVAHMLPGEIDNFGYTKAMYEEEARGLQELSKLFQPRPD